MKKHAILLHNSILCLHFFRCCTKWSTNNEIAKQCWSKIIPQKTTNPRKGTQEFHTINFETITVGNAISCINLYGIATEIIDNIQSQNIQLESIYTVRFE